MVNLKQFLARIMKIKIEKLQDADIPSLMEVEEEAFPLDKWSEAQMRDEFLNHPDGFKVIKKGRKVIAYIYFKIDGNGIICSLAVSQTEQRKGLGELLMENAIHSLKNQYVPKTILYTRKDNLPMISLGKKLGFKITDQINNYYPKNGKAIVLSLPLN